jgi:hypothetical protein
VCGITFRVSLLSLGGHFLCWINVAASISNVLWTAFSGSGLEAPVLMVYSSELFVEVSSLCEQIRFSS